MKPPFKLHLEFGDDRSMPILRFLLCLLGIGFVLGLVAARVLPFW